MSNVGKKSLKVKIDHPIEKTSAILTSDASPHALLVLSHGAGASMEHPFMDYTATCLAELGIASLRFNFAYMESGRRSPDRKPAAIGVIDAIVNKAAKLKPELPLYLGGKSFGGRMSSHFVHENPDAPIRGLIYFGFPLHAPGKPGIARADHLKEIKNPMLFLQGTRDKLAEIPLIESVVDGLNKATLNIYEGADHSFNMLKRSGITQEETIKNLADDCNSWIKQLEG